MVATSVRPNDRSPLCFSFLQENSDMLNFIQSCHGITKMLWKSVANFVPKMFNKYF